MQTGPPLVDTTAVSLESTLSPNLGLKTPSLPSEGYDKLRMAFGSSSTADQVIEYGNRLCGVVRDCHHDTYHSERHEVNNVPPCELGELDRKTVLGLLGEDDSLEADSLDNCAPARRGLLSQNARNTFSLHTR